MERKYKLLEDEIITVKDDNGKIKTLYRIEAVKDFEDIFVGDKGGFIEKEDNLSHSGKCWVYHEAKVYGNAKIIEDAIVYNRATVAEHAICSGISRVCDSAYVGGFAQISNGAKIHEDAMVNGCAVISGHARVSGNATVTGMSNISDTAMITGDSCIHSGYISKDAIINGSIIIDGNLAIGDKALIMKQSDFMSISGIGLGCETLTAYRTTSDSTNIIYSGGFIGSIGEFTKYISDTSIFGDNTTEELRKIIQLILSHRTTDFSSDEKQIEEDTTKDTDEEDDILDDVEEDEYDSISTLEHGLVTEQDEEMAE